MASDSFRMSGVYWALTALALMDTPVSASHDESALVAWVHSCYKPERGCFAPNTHHDGNLLSTLSAVQIMALLGRLDELNAAKIGACVLQLSAPALAGQHRPISNLLTSLLHSVHRACNTAWCSVCDTSSDAHIMATSVGTCTYILLLLTACCAAVCKSLQLPDGSFMGDTWGELDTRFVYAALHCAALLGQLSQLDVGAAADYVMRCQNFDGAFGLEPGCESHTGQVFCCVGALAIAGKVDLVDRDRLGRWCDSSAALQPLHSKRFAFLVVAHAECMRQCHACTCAVTCASTYLWRV